jgi:hypothetical protein
VAVVGSLSLSRLQQEEVRGRRRRRSFDPAEEQKPSLCDSDQKVKERKIETHTCPKRKERPSAMPPTLSAVLSTKVFKRNSEGQRREAVLPSSKEIKMPWQA